MKRYCEYAVRTSERIKCDKLKSLCIHQFYKQCIGMFELTEWSQECKVKNIEDNQSR